MSEARLMQGNEACVEAALAAGLKFFAGYPITPSTEIAEMLAERLPARGGTFIQMEDEISSMAAVIGASLAGVKAMTATSGPGFSLKQENIGFASMAEVPCVVVNVQRGGPSTGLPTSPAQGDLMQSRWGTHGDHPVVVMAPGSVAEVFTVTIQAFNVAEVLRVPVILLMDEVVGHMREKVLLPEASSLTVLDRRGPVEGEEYRPFDYRDGERPLDLPMTKPPLEVDFSGDGLRDVPPLAPFGRGYRFHVTGLVHDARGLPTGDPTLTDRLVRRLIGKVENRRDRLALYVTEAVDDAEVLVVAFGSVGRSALSAVRLARERGIRAGLFRPITVWPFPDQVIRKLTQGARTVIVPEMNMGQMVREVERALAGTTAAVQGYSRVDGELITPTEILAEIEEVA